MQRWMTQLIAFPAMAVAIAFPTAGAELTPADNIQQALDTAAPGDTIVLKDGVYYQSLAITRGGKPGRPVTLKAANGGRATISGAVPPTETRLKFVPVEEDPGMYKAAVPHRVWWVMVDGRNLVNYGYFSYLKTFEFPDQSSGALKPCVPEGFAWRNGSPLRSPGEERRPECRGHRDQPPGRWPYEQGTGVRQRGPLGSGHRFRRPRRGALLLQVRRQHHREGRPRGDRGPAAAPGRGRRGRRARQPGDGPRLLDHRCAYWHLSARRGEAPAARNARPAADPTPPTAPPVA